MSEESTSMRDDINAALDAADDTGESYEETPQEVYSDTDETASIETPESEGENASSKETDESQEVGESEPDGLPATAEGVGEASATATEPEDKRSLKAPIDWSPKEREDWSRIPRPLQEKVLARETAMSEMMANSKAARDTHSQFSELTNRYGSVLSGVAGNTPMEAVGNLFDTVANLRMGSELQKAQTIANLIEDFGVDIASLDSVIVGQVPQHNPNAEVERLLNERLAPFEQHQQQLAYQQQEAERGRQQAATSEVQQFAESAEFLSDVRMDMADMIDMAAKRGQNLTMKQAYDRACAIHPQISGILEQRAKTAQITQGNNSVAAKRQAASGLKGGRVGNNAANSNMSLRDQIAAAWDGE